MRLPSSSSDSEECDEPEHENILPSQMPNLRAVAHMALQQNSTEAADCLEQDSSENRIVGRSGRVACKGEGDSD